MFVDELTIHAKAGNGGDGAVRWLRMRSKAKGGPAGGDGGRGGNVYIEGVRDLSLLSKYTGDNRFHAEDGAPGEGRNLDGKNGEDRIIKLPIGSRVTNVETGEVYELHEEGERIEVLHGGNGGYGNAHFKSASNQAPEDAIPGQKTEEYTFHIELTLGVDVGLIGFPNAGKSTLLNTFTNATAAIGSYPFTTLEPHLGELYGYILADIPGLIKGASTGKGLGHKFLRHASRAQMLLHLISPEQEDPVASYTAIRNELEAYNPDFLKKEEWIVLTKSDLLSAEEIERHVQRLKAETNKPVYVISAQEEEGTKELRDTLVAHLRKSE